MGLYPAWFGLQVIPRQLRELLFGRYAAVMFPSAADPDRASPRRLHDAIEVAGVE